MTGDGARFGRRRFLAGAAGLAAGLAVSTGARVRLPELVTRCRFGAYAANEPYPVQPHADLEASLGGTRLPVCSWFQEWGGTWPAAEAAEVAAAGGYDLLMCLEAHGVAFADVLAGDHDDYLREYATAASAYPGLVVLRPFHESNSDWYDWTPGSGRGFVADAAQWRETWRHVVTVVRGTGVANVRFLFCVNGTDVGGTTMEELWPGAGFVDLIGCDAYSWDGPGTSFDSVHGAAYRRLTALHPTAEYWVGETGLEQQAGSADWYAGAYGSRQFPRMTTVCWFSSGDFEVDQDAGAVVVHRRELPRAPQYWGAG